MRITEARIYSFGKLQKKEFRFGPGINVVYGANESGKTTLHAFLTAMLFGMEKNRGRSKATEGYLRYEPWHSPAYYSGALRFDVAGRPFYLERNFYHKEKRELLRNEADGEELSVAYGDLAMLLGGISGETFGNTYDIPQCKTVNGTETKKVLAEYLSDVSNSGDAAIHVSRALGLLTVKRKELNADLRKEQEQRRQAQSTLRMEQRLLESDCVRLREELSVERRQLDAMVQKQAAENTSWEQTQVDAPVEEAEARSKVHSAVPLIAGLLLSAVLLLNFGLYRAYGYPANWFIVTELLLGMGAAAALTVSIRRFKTAKRQGEKRRGLKYKAADQADRCREQTADGALHRGQTDAVRQVQQAHMQMQRQVERAREQARQMYEKREDMLLEKETRLYNIAEQLEQFEMPGEYEREIIMNIQAVQMAEDEIARLASEYGENAKDELNSEVSRLVSAITDGRYDSVRVTKDGGLCVLTEGKEVPPDALSRGTLEQFYLAFRLAAGSVVTKEEPLPIFLDETFAMYDDERLSQVLKVLAGLRNQVILFTCQKREMLRLDELGIPYCSLKLGE